MYSREAARIGCDDTIGIRTGVARFCACTSDGLSLTVDGYRIAIVSEIDGSGMAGVRSMLIADVLGGGVTSLLTCAG